jgi:hypothetical protein
VDGHLLELLGESDQRAGVPLLVARPEAGEVDRLRQLEVESGDEGLESDEPRRAVDERRKILCLRFGLGRLRARRRGRFFRRFRVRNRGCVCRGFADGAFVGLPEVSLVLSSAPFERTSRLGLAVSPRVGLSARSSSSTGRSRREIGQFWPIWRDKRSRLS